MNFSERLGQVIYATWGFKATGNLEKEGFLVFSPPGPPDEPEAADLRNGIYSFYMYERNQRGAPVCLARDLKIHGGWSLVPVGDGRRPGYLGIRSESGVFYSCRTYQSWLLFCLSFVVEYSPLDVLECYLRPDAGPLLTQWVDCESKPEEE